MPSSDDTSDTTLTTKRYTELLYKERLLRVLMDSLPIIVWAIDLEGTCTIHDGKGLAPVGLRPGQYLGMNVFDIYSGSPVTEDIRRAVAGETVHSFVDAHGATLESWIVPSRDEHGDISAVVGITLDSSEGKRIEQELRAQLDLVSRQQKVIRELATPIIEVWDRVLTLPMVGVVDSSRTAEVMDSLLDAVARSKARFAILDLTGVEAVDTKTAAYLIDLVRALRLLGAEGVITGIRPTVAQTVVALGLDLSAVTTLSNLRAGLRYCIVQMSRERPQDGGSAPAR